MQQQPRVLLVEDDLTIRLAVEVALRGERYEVHAEDDGRAVAQVAEAFRPDLAVLDVHLPAGPNGYEIAALLRRSSTLPLLFLTSADSTEDVLAGFRAGADDYLVKPFSMAELLARVDALLRRSGRLLSSSLQVGDVVVDPGARTVQRAGAPVELTRIEHDLLVLLTRHAGRVLSKTQLLTQVWGFDAYDSNLVEVHVSALRRKLEAHGPRIIHTVRGAGYVLRC
ncbi:MAG: two component transcriptional regulator, winged helix family [Frankiales bacterium]|nr:two component transcriptional regulator, winged helix family [Frankiales bacterium]